ncbi:MAG TPA: hypothetical protein VII34_00575, partial [Pyrinomonadaceae bacterium]
VTAAQRVSDETVHSKFKLRNPKSSSPGLWSELRFRLRRPLGILTGTIDKLLITPSVNGAGLDVEIIDFKTNRFRSPAQTDAKPRQTVAAAAIPSPAKPALTPRAEIDEIGVIASKPAQAFFNFEAVSEEVPAQVISSAAGSVVEPELSIEEQAEAVARDYQLQMQSYALSLRALLGHRTGSGPGFPRGQPGGGSDRVNESPDTPLANEFKINTLRATLHFIDPNVEISLPASLLDQDTCARAIDDAMLSIAALDGTLDTDLFPPLPATHCRICNFLELCPAGREWLRQHRD